MHNYIRYVSLVFFMRGSNARWIQRFCQHFVAALRYQSLYYDLGSLFFNILRMLAIKMWILIHKGQMKKIFSFICVLIMSVSISFKYIQFWPNPNPFTVSILSHVLCNSTKEDVFWVVSYKVSEMLQLEINIH